MLHGVELLCSVVVVALARLVRYVLSIKALMSLCSPRSALQLLISPAPATASRTIKKARPVVSAASVAVAVDERSSSQPADQYSQAQQPPPLLLPPAFKGEGGLLLADGTGTPTATAAKAKAKVKAGRGRPKRLVIPPPVAARAGVNPFGDAAGGGWETDVAAAEVEAHGEGFCVASRRGVRHAMEDAYGVITDKIGEDSRMAFYGVYDGHGGRAAVDLVADKLGKNIVAALSSAAATAPSRRDKQPGPQSSSSTSRREDDDHLGVMAAIRAAYLTTDSEFLSQGSRGGACAATALVKDGELYVANVGDCRAVLGTRGGVATALTSDHTPGREDERLRIENSGGYVSRGSGGVWRVQDSLAVSRAFGDADMRPWVTCEPEVARRRLTPDCAFVVLASDGLWTKVSNQEAVHAIATQSSSSSSSDTNNTGVSMDSCKELVAMARSRGSRDDITVMVVDLQRFLPAVEML